ncbi:MAG: glucose-6-phosphate isomerase [Gemmatimonadota bacterium]
MSPLTLDYTNMLGPSLDGAGLDPERISEELSRAFDDAMDGVEERKKRGELGFLELPYASETARQVQEAADGFGQWFENLVVLGIGGSSLGTRALADALLATRWNERAGDERDHFPRLYVVDNPDPRTLAGLLDGLEAGRTLFNVVSKSGSTAETMAQYLVADEWLRKELGGEEEARGHFLFTTDPTQGALRQIADAEGIPSLPVPPNVGGRFSVLSPVGLFPAAAVGIDIDELLAGAAEMENRCRSRTLQENPAGLFAVLLHAAHVERGAGVHVLMPYGDRLRTVGLWFQQLWAESLGKKVEDEGGVRHVGPTPLAAVGATDQHSLLQLFMEGPADRVVCFLEAREEEDLMIPELHPGVDALGYLGGHTLGELLSTEKAATAEALRRRGRMNLTLELDRVGPRSMGELFLLLEMATVIAGGLYRVDPLDQPGVELGKQLTYGLLGRDGYDAPDLGTGEARWRV